MEIINVIFPMAGDGVRFGGTFKPFLYATEKKFITHAKEPFDILKVYYRVKYIFIYRQDQEDKYNVKRSLELLFPEDEIHVCILPAKTRGPIDTLKQAVTLLGISGISFTSDCDHSVQIQPMLDLLLKSKNKYPALLIPTWDISEADTINWGTLKISDTNEIISIQEKTHMMFGEGYKIIGIIGSCFWKDISIINCFPSLENISDIIPLLKGDVYCIPLTKGEFFGTSDKLVEFRSIRAKQKTFFIDIDGTLLHLGDGIRYDITENSVLPGTIEKLEGWKKDGHTIILTTGRESKMREKLVELLSSLKIPYDNLITGLPSGCRILINDKNPIMLFRKWLYLSR